MLKQHILHEKQVVWFLLFSLALGRFLHGRAEIPIVKWTDGLDQPTFQFCFDQVLKRCHDAWGSKNCSFMGLWQSMKQRVELIWWSPLLDWDTFDSCGCDTSCEFILDAQVHDFFSRLKQSQPQHYHQNFHESFMLQLDCQLHLRHLDWKYLRS